MPQWTIALFCCPDGCHRNLEHVHALQGLSNDGRKAGADQGQAVVCYAYHLGEVPTLGLAVGDHSR